MMKGLASTKGSAMKKLSETLPCIRPKVMDSIAVIAMSKKVKNNEANEKHERGSDELLAVAERLRRYW